MDIEQIEARVREIELTLLAHRSLIVWMLAEFAVSNDGMRKTLEDIMAQAVAAREIHIPPDLGKVMPDVYRIILDLLGTVNKTLTVPLRPRAISKDR